MRALNFISFLKNVTEWKMKCLVDLFTFHLRVFTKYFVLFNLGTGTVVHQSDS